MTNYITKALLLIFSLAVFGVTPGYALNFNETQKLLPSDGASFGQSVSISADIAVIGAPVRGTGSAYVYERDSTGLWREQQMLTASDGAAGDRFAWSVSTSGNTVVIGAWGDTTNGNESGSAYVFVRDGTGAWSEQQKLTPSDGAVGDHFGVSLALSGDTAVITANRDDDNGSRSGSAYVFVRDGTGMWREQQKLTASDAAAGDRFGFKVSLSGQTAVIGATEDDNTSGAAYMFERDSSGYWREQQKLTASDRAAGDGFGIGLSITDDTAVIGAFADDDNGFNSGSAYVFVRDGTGVWREQQKLTASDGATWDRFGGSISISGDTAVIGADEDASNGSGSAYVFVRDGTGVWREQQKLIASDGDANDSFGWSVSLSGDTAMIGAFKDDDNGSGSGSVYVFEARDSNNDLLNIEKLINHHVRPTAGTAAELLVGTRYRVDYKVTNNSPNRVYNVQVFEGGQLVCNLYALDPAESKQPNRCANNQDVLAGLNNVPANITAKVSATSHELANRTNAYYIGFGDMPGKLKVTHYVNNKNADTQASAAVVNGNQAEILFRVENTGSIKLYRVKTYHDPVSPTDSGWQQQCFFGTMMPGQVRYCKRAISVTQVGLNKVFGRAQGEDANVSPIGFVNASNPTYFNGLVRYSIGDTGPAGGKVFYITDGGLHGLEAAPADSAASSWGCIGVSIPGAQGTDIGTGTQNTAAIMAGCTDFRIAAKRANDFSLNGFADWFLPSKDALYELYVHRAVVGGFTNNVYWSSSEFDSNNAWHQVIVSGNQSYAYKGESSGGVRAVRAF